MGRRRVGAGPHVSAALRPGDGRRLHRLCGLRPHPRDLPGTVQQSGEFPRLSLRPAAADGLLTTDDGGRRTGDRHSVLRPLFSAVRPALRRRGVRSLLDRHALPSHGGHQGRRRRLRDAARARLLRPGPRRAVRPAALHPGLDDAPQRRALSRLPHRARAHRRAARRGRRDPVPRRPLFRAWGHRDQGRPALDRARLPAGRRRARGRGRAQRGAGGQVQDGEDRELLGRNPFSRLREKVARSAG